MTHPHPLANVKTNSPEQEEVIISIIDPDQEADIAKRRHQLMRLRLEKERMRSLAAGALINYRKRNGNWLSEMTESSRKRLRTKLHGRLDMIGGNSHDFELIDILTDNLWVHVFSFLPQFPTLLTVRQVCKRWERLSCNPRLWTSLSFAGHEHVKSANLEALCNNNRISLRKLKHLSLAKTHRVSDHTVRQIPRTDCAATLQSVDLSWCSGATDKSVVEFSRCPGLRELRLSHCRMVSRRSVRILAVRCPRLEVLDLNCINGMRDTLLEAIGQNCPCLKVLNIANGRNITDGGIEAIADGCPRLEVLDLSWCTRVTDGAVSKIAANMKNLRELGLSETRVSDWAISELVQGCSKLEALHLARCAHISDFGVQSIIRYCSQRLTSLNLASCQSVSDVFVEKLIEQCLRLTCLDVSKLPCRPIAGILDRLTRTRKIQVYF